MIWFYYVGKIKNCGKIIYDRSLVKREINGDRSFTNKFIEVLDF